MSEDKISYKQAVMLFLLSFLSPGIRYMPMTAAKVSKESGWIAPLFAIPILIIFIYMINALIKKYNKQSYVDIIKDVFGKYIGTIICLVIFAWLLFITVYNLRFHVERILMGVMPNFEPTLMAFLILTICVIVLAKGLVPFARMGEIFFLVVVTILFLSIILMLPKENLSNLFPITMSSLTPSLKVGLNVASFWHLYIPILILMDKIEKKENLKKISIYAAIFFVIVSIVIIAIPYGIYGYSIIAKMPASFMNSVKEITFLGIFDRIDSLIVVLWTFTDFTQTALSIYAAVYLVKKIFNIQKTNSILFIYVVALYYLCLSFVSSYFEIAKIGENFIFIPGFILAFGLPLILFITGKIRKKI